VSKDLKQSLAIVFAVVAFVFAFLNFAVAQETWHRMTAICFLILACAIMLIIDIQNRHE